MKLKLIACAMAAPLCGLLAGDAAAQVQLAAEGRLGVTFPIGDISDAGAEAGLSAGAELHAGFHPSVAAYVGLHRHGFNTEAGWDLGGSPRSTGLAAGLKYTFHSPGDIFVWARGGIVANQFATADLTRDRNVGFEIGLGGDMPVAGRLSLVPNIGFVTHDAGGGMTASFVTFGLGLRYPFN